MTEEAKAIVRPKKPLSTRVAHWARWLHIYVSMLGLMAVLFFSVTGITLNHPDWFFADVQSFDSAKGKLDESWVGGDEVRRLEISEYLRTTHGLRGAITEFTVDDVECAIIFKGAGYTADIYIDRETGAYNLSESSVGLVGILNALHKGGDTGPAWSLVIDVVAVLLTLASCTGLLLLLYLKKRRRNALLAACAGTLALVLIYVFAVP